MKRVFVPLCVAGALLAGLLLAAGCGTTLTPMERAAMHDSSIVAIYADQTLTLDAFENEYARSVGDREAARADSLAAYQDFLERYVNFRLKVIEGDSAGYYEDPSIRSEINSYRSSFAKPYLLDKEVLNPIISTLYERRKELIDVSHILLRVPPDASPEDTLAAYQKLAALRDSVQQGADFGDLAVRHSEDPSAQRPEGQPGSRGHLGYFTAGRMVASFEDVAYATPAGEVSPVFRTRFGYHLLYVHDRMPAVPDIRVSHLMIRPESATAEDSAKALAEIRDLKARIDEGESFTELARTFSDDQRSGQQGGDLGYLTYDNFQVDATFREAAFGIDSLNTVSDVIETPYGYHLLMITDRRPLGTYEEEYESLKKTAADLPRTDAAERELAADIRMQYGVHVDTTAVYEILEPVGLDSLMIKLGGATFADSLLARSIASIGDTTYTLRDLAVYASRAQIPRANDLGAQIDRLVEGFLNDAALAYESAALEGRDSDFKRIMQEFRDGLVLFRLMEDSVWTAAQQDSAGLRAYFDAHADEYWTQERTRIIELRSRSDSLLHATVARIDSGTVTLDALAQDIVQDTTLALSIDTMLVEGQTESVYDEALELTPGQHTDVLSLRPVYVVLFRQDEVPPAPQSFEEARSLVVNDYQSVVEDRLIERLREKYNVHTFPERLTRAFTDSTTATSTTASSVQ